MTDDEFESLVAAFERAWRKSGSCDIGAFLDQNCAVSSQPRIRVLRELICIDLEFRWRQRSHGTAEHEAWLLEDYAVTFRELGPIDQWPLELVAQEYRVRSQWGDRPAHNDVINRFHGREQHVSPALYEVDRELAEERRALHSIAPVTSRLLKRDDESELPAGVLQIPHQDLLLKRMIGAGCMGKVYEALQQSSDRVVAVKFLRKSYINHPGIVHKFLSEAGLTAKLTHPNIVEILGMGRTTGGAYFIVMKLVSGSNLETVLTARAISVEEAVRWTMATCAALEHAHAAGVVHCDLKPANLLLDEFGELKVTDFGLARQLGDESPWVAEIEGTAPYMAPEQVSRCWGEIDVRTDVYGIGAVLYAFLTGRPPYLGGRLPEVLAEVISAGVPTAPVVLRSEVPLPLSDVCMRCLSKRPDARFCTVGDVRSALVSLAGDLV